MSSRCTVRATCIINVDVVLFYVHAHLYIYCTQDSKCYGYGSTDRKIHGIRYLTSDVQLTMVIFVTGFSSQTARMEYHSRRVIPPHSEVKKQDNSTSGPRDGVRIISNRTIE